MSALDLFAPEPKVTPDLSHWLVVKAWDPELFEDGNLLEVEHHPDCPTEVRGDKHPYGAHICAVAGLVEDAGIDGYFQHRDDPGRDSHWVERVAPGRWPIEPWFETYHGFEYTEYDAGLRVVDPPAPATPRRNP